jgi:glycosyltransferase involved in cell wall biosynthesis/GT2 family glycosyltransferase
MKVCIVTTDLQSFIKNGGVGTAKSNLAKYLALYSKVDILFCHSPGMKKNVDFKINSRHYQNLNINIISLIVTNYAIDVDHIYAYISFLVYENLKNSDYDKIIFPEMHGLGYYCMRAKKLNLFFSNTELITFFHGPGEWHIEHNDGLPTSMQDLMTFYIEKQSCLMADRTFFATNYSKQLATKMEYIIPTQKTEVLVFPFDFPQVNKIKKVESITEICFFGRLENRKGIHTFLNAIIALNKNGYLDKIKITLLGSFGYIDSSSADQFLLKWMENHPINLNILNSLSKNQAIAYLREPGRVAVICSKEETLGYALVESITEEIPFICSDIPPFIEVIEFLQPTNPNVFKKDNFIDLARVIKLVLNKKPKSTSYKNEVIINLPQRWLKLIAKNLPISTNSAVSKIKKVSACIIFFDRPLYLQDLIDSLMEVHSVKEILIYVNSDQEIASKNLIKKLAKNSLIKICRDKANVSPGQARNFLSRIASNEFLFFIDDDNIVNPEKLNKILSHLNDDWDLIVSPLDKFQDQLMLGHFTTGHSIPEISTQWVPIGNDLNFNIYLNRIGDANFFIKKSYMEKLNGFNENLSYGEDQEFLMRATFNGCNYQICPESFIFYRIHNTNLSSRGKSNQQRSQLQSAILKAIGANHLGGAVNISQAMLFEKDRNPGRAMLNELIMHTLSHSIKNRMTNKKHISSTLKKILLNPFIHHDSEGFIECHPRLQNPKMNKLIKKMESNQALVLDLYLPTSGKYFFNGNPVELKEGYSKIVVKFNSKEGLNISSLVPETSLFIIDFELR